MDASTGKAVFHRCEDVEIGVVKNTGNKILYFCFLTGRKCAL